MPDRIMTVTKCYCKDENFYYKKESSSCNCIALQNASVHLQQSKCTVPNAFMFAPCWSGMTSYSL